MQIKFFLLKIDFLRKLNIFEKIDIFIKITIFRVRFSWYCWFWYFQCSRTILTNVGRLMIVVIIVVTINIIIIWHTNTAVNFLIWIIMIFIIDLMSGYNWCYQITCCWCIACTHNWWRWNCVDFLHFRFSLCCKYQFLFWNRSFFFFSCKQNCKNPILSNLWCFNKLIDASDFNTHQEWKKIDIMWDW